MRTNEFVIRYGIEDDLPPVEHLLHEVVSQSTLYTSEARAAEIARYNRAFLGAMLAEDRKAILIALAGDSCVGISISNDQCGPLWINWLVVKAEMRRRGIGEALVRHLLVEAAARDATKIWCDTLTNNHSAISLFTKLGFRRLCELKNHWHGQNYFLWERMLGPSVRT
jgi:ribosomal protein S18 acetylase RimI-like enzyme